jgi:hypothetical protein
MDEKHLPEGNRLKENFYTAKSMMKPLDLRYHKIDMCTNFCMMLSSPSIGHVGIPIINLELAWKNSCSTKKLTYFLITPRLPRLIRSPKTTEHMT